MVKLEIEEIYGNIKDIKIRCKFKDEIGNICDLLRTIRLNLQGGDSPLEKM